MLWAQGGAYRAPLAHELGIEAVVRSYGWGVGLAGRSWKDDQWGWAWQADLTSYRLREEVRTRSAYRDQSSRDYVFRRPTTCIC